MERLPPWSWKELNAARPGKHQGTGRAGGSPGWGFEGQADPTGLREGSCELAEAEPCAISTQKLLEWLQVVVVVVVVIAPTFVTSVFLTFISSLKISW